MLTDPFFYHYYSDKHIISDDYARMFVENRKKDLNTAERVGLESILSDFMTEYYTEEGLEPVPDIRQYTYVTSDGCVRILDGCYDTEIFDQYAIAEVWMTYGGSVIMTAYDLNTSPAYEEDGKYGWEIVQDTDWESECKPVYFRLD